MIARYDDGYSLLLQPIPCHHFSFYNNIYIHNDAMKSFFIFDSKIIYRVDEKHGY